ncbi:hypothetical protein SLNWT_5901 [Streptomyces albus]|uniref:Uncharacterized protein n=1 Tax=Streptomyces albus (strain ATCC 21838 / DSM 41398 / FERM P-419 / JCM 4703 / NBRC 107858) TaxID=1081613 RepID=A0A0B5F765_STRA4|nr:hypothetical protein SLNWT_5901 [Streptomyces albus]AOU80579.1 hypothetical protein SLNHY_5888 [Streptomyces albus]AYN36290.1 hypothetical protein DUI70_5795 [Streptomyces albus]
MIRRGPPAGTGGGRRAPGARGHGEQELCRVCGDPHRVSVFVR